jgi:large subunit ribosomal protein L30
MTKYILVKKIKSCIRQPKKNKLLMKSLGLKKINHTSLIKNNHASRVLIFKIQHLISIKEQNNQDL